MLHILLALAEGTKHGYAIKQDIEQRTDGAICLGPGTLYEAIQRLEESGLIAETEPAAPANGQEAQRRFYRLTERGWSTLRTEDSATGDGSWIRRRRIRGCAKASHDAPLPRPPPPVSVRVPDALRRRTDRAFVAERLEPRQAGALGLLRFIAGTSVYDLVTTATRQRTRGIRRCSAPACRDCPLSHEEDRNGHAAAGPSLRVAIQFVRRPGFTRDRACCRWRSASAATASFTVWSTGSSCSRFPIPIRIDCVAVG